MEVLRRIGLVKRVPCNLVDQASLFENADNALLSSPGGMERSLSENASWTDIDSP